MIYSSRYSHFSQPVMPWLRAVCQDDGCLFGHWCQNFFFDDYWMDDEVTYEVYWKRLPSHFISGTLLLHKSPFLESFHLKSVSERSASEIGLWVRIAVDRFVRDLKISFYFDHGLIRLPSRLFRCETLETGELRKVIYLQVPCQFSFRSLKTLRLLFVKYADEESFVRLISNCPVLEDLVELTCHDDNVVTCTFDVPSLRSLNVWNVNTTLEDSEPNDSLFVIHSHCLNRLTIIDEFGKVNVIGKLSELVEARLDMLQTQGNALESLTFVKHLFLTVNRGSQFPIGSVFFRLVYLEFQGSDENWSDFLVHVLHSPMLKILKLFVFGDKLGEVCWIQPSCIPECLLFHLKTLEWIDYEGIGEEKEVAIYILKNARQLVTATVCPDPRKHQVFEELEIASRGSRACELTMG